MRKPLTVYEIKGVFFVVAGDAVVLTGSAACERAIATLVAKGATRHTGEVPPQALALIHACKGEEK